MNLFDGTSKMLASGVLKIKNMKKTTRTKIIIISFILFILYGNSYSFFIKRQHFKDKFSGILISKRYSPPSAVVFYFEDKLGKHKKGGNGATFFEAIAIGDSIVKKKDEQYIYVYKKNHKTYKYYGKFDY